MGNSAMPGFNKLSVRERMAKLAEFAGLTEEEKEILQIRGSLPEEIADHMIENYVTNMEIPMGIATNFRINGKDYLIPMAIEEPSVIAGCSYSAKIAREKGGFRSYSSEPLMVGQIQIMDLHSPEAAAIDIYGHKEELLNLANEKSRTLSKLNAGAKDLYTERYESPQDMLILNLIVDVRDAMGANVVNTMCEHISPRVEEITGGRVNLRILTNLTDLRMSYSTATFSSELIGGPEVAMNVIEAYNFARADIHRAATHNKGVMNGVDAVLLATLNDWRAVEAGAHSYYSRNGYGPFTEFSLNDEGDIVGTIRIPMAVGTVGGSTGSVPKAGIARKILGAKSSGEFGEILAAVGLAQNFAAVRALSSEGIQKGHMKLHSRNLAMSAGASGDLIDRISAIMVKEGNISLSRAREILAELSGKR